MRLNTGIIALSLPSLPQFICSQPDHKLVLCDVRVLTLECDIFDDDILYFAEWPILKQLAGYYPSYLICMGGGAEAYDYFNCNNITGIVTEGTNPTLAFGIIQSIFLRYNQLEDRLMRALLLKEPMQEILNCCSDFFQNHSMLFDCDFNLIDYSTNYLPDDDPVWKETLATKKSSGKYSQTKNSKQQHGAVGSLGSEILDLGGGNSRNLVYSFYYNSKRTASLVINENNKPISPYQLRLLDYLSDMIGPSLRDRYSSLYGSLENLRTVFVTVLNKVNVDPLVVNRCLNSISWDIKDDFLLILISFSDATKKLDSLTRYIYLYDNIFPDCITFRYIDNIVLIVHNDTPEIMTECLPKLEKQLIQHDAVCGVSFGFDSILQINSQYANASLAIQLGDQTKRICYLKDVMTNYLINQIANETPLIPLCHRGAVHVYEYDVANGAELLITLETYLRHNRSVTAAAEELYIHQSTLKYRIGCIEKIAKLNFNDSKERLHILLTCIVLRNLDDRHLGSQIEYLKEVKILR